MTALEVFMPTSPRDELVARIRSVLESQPDASPGFMAELITEGWKIQRRRMESAVSLVIELPPRQLTEEEGSVIDQVELAQRWSALHEGPPPEYVSHAQLVDQARWWRSADGPIEVSQMTEKHAFNVLALLWRRMPGLRFEWELMYRFQHAPDEVQAAAERMTDEEWFAECPLVWALTNRQRFLRGEEPLTVPYGDCDDDRYTTQ